jgi:hypothetical protein
MGKCRHRHGLDPNHLFRKRRNAYATLEFLVLKSAIAKAFPDPKERAQYIKSLIQAMDEKSQEIGGQNET